MTKTKVLITVKTYPTISGKYDELVCTAGFTEDGKWIRIYPVPFRKKSYEEQYKKYEWIEVDLVKNKSDFRPESYRPKSMDSNIARLEKIGTQDNWAKRKEIVLNKVYTNLEQLIAEAKDRSIGTSLAVFKPTEIHNFLIEPDEPEWNKKKIEKLKANRDQMNLFEHSDDIFEIVKKLPYKFRFEWVDDSGKKTNMMIEDWEVGALYWRMLGKYEGDEDKALEAVRKKYYDDFSLTKDLHFFLGTTQQFHNVAPNPFIIIGTFTPKIETQTKLF